MNDFEKEVMEFAACVQDSRGRRIEVPAIKRTARNVSWPEFITMVRDFITSNCYCGHINPELIRSHLFDANLANIGPYPAERTSIEASYEAVYEALRFIHERNEGFVTWVPAAKMSDGKKLDMKSLRLVYAFIPNDDMPDRGTNQPVFVLGGHEHHLRRALEADVKWAIKMHAEIGRGVDPQTLQSRCKELRLAQAKRMREYKPAEIMSAIDHFCRTGEFLQTASGEEGQIKLGYKMPRDRDPYLTLWLKK